MTTGPAAAAALPAAWILDNSDVRLWGLTGSQRLERQLRLLAVTSFLREARPATAGSVLVVRSDFLFDDRTLASMLASPATILEVTGPEGSTAVAAHVPAAQAAAARDVLEGNAAAGSLAGVTVQDAATLGASYVKKVLKANQPLVLPIRADRVDVLERYLFGESYKGVTDVVTKFVWPTPARHGVRLCTNFGIRPNGVTGVSFVLVIAALYLFAHGHFAAGLAAAWIMTFLDTVDGKLARVTVTSTQVGHIFDHGIDLVSPPLWYLAWAKGVGGAAGISAMEGTLIAIFAGYLGGRFVERWFSHRVGGFSLFSWQPFDSFFRLITGRRNPNLILLSLFTMLGMPAAGLEAVGAWTVASTLILAFRMMQASRAKAQGEVLRPWLEQLGSGSISSVPRYARSFVSDPAGRLSL